MNEWGTRFDIEELLKPVVVVGRMVTGEFSTRRADPL